MNLYNISKLWNERSNINVTEREPQKSIIGKLKYFSIIVIIYILGESSEAVNINTQITKNFILLQLLCTITKK